MARLLTKFETARQLVPKPIVDEIPGANIGILAYGSTLPAIEEARHLLTQRGIVTSFLRVRALPIDNTVRDFVAKHEAIYVVELNRDGQLLQILTSEMPAIATRLFSIARINGLPLDAAWLVNRITEQTKRISRQTMPSKELI